jgi:autotransporter translocation and assembly factor TamB
MSDITQQLSGLIKSDLKAKDFKTGSKGFFGSAKITGADGTRYQAHAQAVLIGSKGDPKARARASVAEISAALTGLVQEGVPAADFKTGNTGYRTQGKVEAHGQRYQVNVQAVKLAA